MSDQFQEEMIVLDSRKVHPAATAALGAMSCLNKLEQAAAIAILIWCTTGDDAKKAESFLLLIAEIIPQIATMKDSK